MSKGFSTQTEIGVTQNDIFLDNNGNISIVQDLESIKQACQHAALAQRGEMIFDQNRGIPNFQLIWKGVPNLIQYQSELRQAFLNVDGVIEVVSLKVTLSNHVLKYSAIIRTIFGGGTISG